MDCLFVVLKSKAWKLSGPLLYVPSHCAMQTTFLHGIKNVPQSTRWTEHNSTILCLVLALF